MAEGDNTRRAQRRQAGLISVFQQGLNADPLWQRLLAGARGAGHDLVIDPEELFADAERQVGAAGIRRSRDSMKTLAALGVGGATSAQAQFFNRALEREKVRTLGGIRGFLDSAAIQQNPLLQLQGVQEQAGTVITREAARTENLGS